MLSFDIVQLLEGGSDLSLVGSSGDDEDEGVHLFDLLHRGLGVQGEQDSLVGIHSRGMRDRLSWVLWCSSELESVGSVEGDGSSNLSDLVALSSLEGSLLGGGGLDGFGLGLGLTGS